ncbi:MAG: NfeD family protein [Oligoflexia bacterium]|nr:NfeD family protein [Oligoflexia bacterium]
MEWWLWLVVGFLLLGAELIVPGGLFLLFFGFGAVVVGLLSLLGVLWSEWLQWLLFSLISISSLILLRARLMQHFGVKTSAAPDIDSMVGDIATPLDSIPPGATGKAELRGSAWSAQNTSQRELSKGQRCRVERVEGLTIFISPI